MKLTGLQKICRLYGRMKIDGVMMVWDYANECAVKESEMKRGSDRWVKSERARWKTVMDKCDTICATKTKQ